MVRLALAASAATLALLVGTASATACPPGTRPHVVCTVDPPICVVVCLPVVPGALP